MDAGYGLEKYWSNWLLALYQQALAAINFKVRGVDPCKPIGQRAPGDCQGVTEGGITSKAFDTACLLWAIGTLIGNTDMHSGNLSCLSEGRRPYELAPAYDMTPMAFAPTAGGGLPNRALELTVGEQVSAVVWKEALVIAQVFVRRLEGEQGFSAGFKACRCELLRHVAVAAERILRLAM